MKVIGIYSGAVIVLLAVGGVLVWGGQAPVWASVFGSSVDGAVAVIRSWGAWGVLGSIVLMTAHSFLPFPAEVVALANGMVYGPLWGTVVTWTGAMIGASAAFGFARLVGRPFIKRFLSSRRQQRLARWSRDQGVAALLLSRFIPVIAFNLINYAAALAEISWWTFLWTTGLGILPLTILLAMAGDRVMKLPLWVWLAVGLVALLVWFILARWRRRQLYDVSDDDCS